MTIGQRMRKRRDDLNMGLTELASRVHLSKQLLYKYENDIVTNIPSDKIEAIADALFTTPASLMGWENVRIDPVSGYPIYDDDDAIIDISKRSDFLYSFTKEEENLLRKIRELEKTYSIPEIERALDFIALYQKAIPEIQAAVESLLKSQKHDS